MQADRAPPFISFWTNSMKHHGSWKVWLLKNSTCRTTQGKEPRKERRPTADWWLKVLVWLAQHHKHSSWVKVRCKTNGQEMWLFSKTELILHFQSSPHREGRSIVPVALGLFSTGGYLVPLSKYGFTSPRTANLVPVPAFLREAWDEMQPSHQHEHQF